MNVQRVVNYLLEGLTLQQSIVESRLDFLKQKNPHLTSDFIDHVASHDPSDNKAYTSVMLKWHKQGGVDLPSAKEALTHFHKNKHLYPDKDINKYTSLDHLKSSRQDPQEEDNIHTPWVRATRAQKLEVAKNAPIIKSENGVIVRRVNSYRAMEVLGSKSKWCVVPNEQQFDYHRASGDIHFIHDTNTGSRYLWHHLEGVKNVRDKELPKVKGGWKTVTNVFPEHMFSSNDLTRQARTSENATALEGLFNAHRDNPWVTNPVVANNKTPQNVLHAWVNDATTHDDLRHVVSNKAASPEVLSAVYEKNKKISDSARDKEMAAHRVEYDLTIHENLPVSLQKEFANRKPVTRTWALAQLHAGLSKNKNAHPDVLHSLASAFVKNPEYPDEEAQPPSPSMRKRIAKHPNTSLKTLKHLEKISNSELARYPKRLDDDPLEDLILGMREDDEEVLHHIQKHPNYRR